LPCKLSIQKNNSRFRGLKTNLVAASRCVSLASLGSLLCKKFFDKAQPLN
jgi:hypothetical protein